MIICFRYICSIGIYIYIQQTIQNAVCATALLDPGIENVGVIIWRAVCSPVIWCRHMMLSAPRAYHNVLRAYPDLYLTVIYEICVC